jgi:hypothetical protein
MHRACHDVLHVCAGVVRRNPITSQSTRALVQRRGKLSKKNYVEKADRRALDRHLRELTQARAPRATWTTGCTGSTGTRDSTSFLRGMFGSAGVLTRPAGCSATRHSRVLGHHQLSDVLVSLFRCVAAAGMVPGGHGVLN